MKLASPEYVKECHRILVEYWTGKLTRAQFEQACYLLQSAAKSHERNALEPTEEELRYAARA